MSSARQAIVSRLRANQEVDDWADLCIYPSGSLFVVEFLPPTGPLDTTGLTDEQLAQLGEDGELNEYFETPEEAADLYLLLESRCAGRLLPKKAAFSDDGAGKKPRSAKKSGGMPALGEDTFEAELSAEGPVAVLFWSAWSAPDRLVLPAVMKVAGASPGVRFFTLDVEESQTVAQGLQVTATPVCLLFRGGVLHARVGPPLTEEALARAVSSLTR